MFIRDPGSRFFPIPDPKTATKKRGEQKIVVIPSYVATNFTRLKFILVLKCGGKKTGTIFKELYNFSRGSKRHRIPDLGSGSATLSTSCIVDKDFFADWIWIQN
jgi:hypothetical protein